jgi:soluble P-type ATPase
MLIIDIPGRGRSEIAHLVFDLNGTLALDGVVPDVVMERVRVLNEVVRVHVVTADTFGTAGRLRDSGVEIQVLALGDQIQAKAVLVRALGASQTIAIGNGNNDEGMLREAALGIAIVGREGAALQALLAADVVVTRIEDALDLLINPKRLMATLRTE